MRVSLGFELEFHQPQTQPSIQDLQRSLESLSTNQTHLHKTQNSVLEQLSNKLKPSLNLNFPVFNSFGPPAMGYLDYNGSLSRLKQKGSLEDDVAEFLRLSCKVSPVCWTEEDLISQFLEGLKDQRVRDLVESLKPESLYDAMPMAWVAKSGGPLLFMQL